MCVDHQRLNLPNREVYLVLFAHGLDYVDRGERRIEGEIKFALVPCLAVSEAGELVRVTETELNLEPGVVDVEHVDSPHRGVGREVEPVRSVSQNVYHQLDIAAQGLAPGHELVCLLALATGLNLTHAAQVKIVEVNPLVDVVQHRVVAEAADQVEADSHQLVDKRLDRERGVGHDTVGHQLELVSILPQNGYVPLVECHLLGFELTAVGRLHGTKHHAVLQVGVNQADAQYLQPMLDSRGTARPKTTHMRSLFARLGHIARVDGDGQTAAAVLEAVGGEVHVELQPVELPLERLSVALLATLAVASELQEIDYSGYGHD